MTYLLYRRYANAVLFFLVVLRTKRIALCRHGRQNPVRNIRAARGAKFRVYFSRPRWSGEISDKIFISLFGSTTESGSHSPIVCRGELRSPAGVQRTPLRSDVERANIRQRRNSGKVAQFGPSRTPVPTIFLQNIALRPKVCYNKPRKAVI